MPPDREPASRDIARGLLWRRAIAAPLVIALLLAFGGSDLVTDSGIGAWFWPIAVLGLAVGAIIGMTRGPRWHEPLSRRRYWGLLLLAVGVALAASSAGGDWLFTVVVWMSVAGLAYFLVSSVRMLRATQPALGSLT